MPYKNPEHKKAYMNRRHQTHQEWIRSMMVERGCADCGISDWRVLHWDHIPPHDRPVLRISEMSRYSKKRILEEIEKCEVVCANCHMIRTRERGQLLAVTPGREGGL